ncbi:MAG TPA: NAD(P)-dependent oxidoreductase, partial [Vicinamibacterales bacterium]|nr:NAD(P)-dependent oxidoreductase [Vicinamibacterales bacterium]
RSLYLHLIQERLHMLELAGIPVHVQDARDYHTLSPLLNNLAPDVLIHLAAVAHAKVANKNPFSTFDNSLRTLENALVSVRSRGTHFIYFSSSMVYGNFATGLVEETTPCEPLGVYGALKFAGEKMVIAYGQAFNMPYTIIRPSALYGQRCVSRRVGQIFIESALAGEPLKVDGDGEEKLDFTYIDDLIEGIALSVTEPAARNEIFNITYGAARPIRDLVEVLKREFGNLKVEHVERDQLMPFRGTLSIDKARQLLGFAPANPIDVGFPKYVKWYRQLMAVA